MVNVAILGYGVVGSGVAEVIRRNGSNIRKRTDKSIVLKKILDIREFPESPDRDIITNNMDEIFEDESIEIIVETIGGSSIAYEYVKKALNMGKHIVTSNKELVAAHGPELMETAKSRGVNFLFEASVGGGIPIIRPLNQCLAANEITGITGILNGTTNYILTQMKNEGMSFESALKSAQLKGYAESDPVNDIEGIDACRKIAILSSIAYNEFVDCKKIHTEGITKITTADIHYAEAMKSVIKLIAVSRKTGDKIFARVSPVIISKTHPLSNVDDVFNAILVKGNVIGDAMFYGKGAGKLPTASAVVADVIDIVNHIDSNGKSVWHVSSKNNIINFQDSDIEYFVRAKVNNKSKAKQFVEKVFTGVKWIIPDSDNVHFEIAFLTGLKPEEQILDEMELIKTKSSIEEISSTIRVFNQ